MIKVKEEDKLYRWKNEKFWRHATIPHDVCSPSWQQVTNPTLINSCCVPTLSLPGETWQIPWLVTGPTGQVLFLKFPLDFSPFTHLKAHIRLSRLESSQVKLSVLGYDKMRFISMNIINQPRVNCIQNFLMHWWKCSIFSWGNSEPANPLSNCWIEFFFILCSINCPTVWKSGFTTFAATEKSIVNSYKLFYLKLFKISGVLLWIFVLRVHASRDSSDFWYFSVKSLDFFPLWVSC